MGRRVVEANRRVRPVWDGGHTDAETRMQTDGEAVLQTLTAVWRGRRHLREYGEGGNMAGNAGRYG